MRRSIKASSFHLGTVTGRFKEHFLTIMVLPKPWKLIDNKDVPNVEFKWEEGVIQQTLMLFENQTLMIEMQNDVNGILEGLLDAVIELSKNNDDREVDQSQSDYKSDPLLSYTINPRQVSPYDGQDDYNGLFQINF